MRMLFITGITTKEELYFLMTFYCFFFKKKFQMTLNFRSASIFNVFTEYLRRFEFGALKIDSFKYENLNVLIFFFVFCCHCFLKTNLVTFV